MPFGPGAMQGIRLPSGGILPVSDQAVSVSEAVAAASGVTDAKKRRRTQSSASSTSSSASTPAPAGGGAAAAATGRPPSAPPSMPPTPGSRTASDGGAALPPSNGGSPLVGSDLNRRAPSATPPPPSGTAPLGAPPGPGFGAPPAPTPAMPSAGGAGPATGPPAPAPPVGDGAAAASAATAAAGAGGGSGNSNAPVIRLVQSHGGHNVDALMAATTSILPRPATNLGRINYDALAPSLRCGQLIQSTWALNTILVITSSEAVMLPPGRHSQGSLDMANAVVEVFWADVDALDAFKRATTGAAPAADAAPASPHACPHYWPQAKLDDLELVEDAPVDTNRHREQLLLERIVTAAVILRNWSLTSSYRSALGASAAVVTVLLYMLAGDLPSLPARTRKMLRAIAWETIATLGPHLKVPGPSATAAGDISPLELLVVACTDGLEAQTEALRLRLALGSEDGAQTRQYMDVATMLTLQYPQELCRCAVPSLRALVAAAIGIVQSLLEGMVMRPEAQQWAQFVQAWIVESVLLLVYNLVKLPVPAAAVREHGPVGRALLSAVRMRIILMLSTRDPSSSNASSYAEAQRLSLRILRELALLPEAYPLIAPHEAPLLALSTYHTLPAQHGLAPITSLATDVLHALAATTAAVAGRAVASQAPAGAHTGGAAAAAR